MRTRTVFRDQIFYDTEKLFLSGNDVISSTLTNNDISLLFGKTVNFLSRTIVIDSSPYQIGKDLSNVAQEKKYLASAKPIAVKMDLV